MFPLPEVLWCKAWQTFSKGPDSNDLWLCEPQGLVITLQLHCSIKTAQNNRTIHKETDAAGCVPIKLYLQRPSSTPLTRLSSPIMYSHTTLWSPYHNLEFKLSHYFIVNCSLFNCSRFNCSFFQTISYMKQGSCLFCPYYKIGAEKIMDITLQMKKRLVFSSRKYLTTIAIA